VNNCLYVLSTDDDADDDDDDDDDDEGNGLSFLMLTASPSSSSHDRFFCDVVHDDGSTEKNRALLFLSLLYGRFDVRRRIMFDCTRCNIVH
jgi:hypothetical protein